MLSVQSLFSYKTACDLSMVKLDAESGLLAVFRDAIQPTRNADGA